MKYYWIKLFRDERGEELVENCLINALLVGLVCTAIAVSALRVRYAVCTAAVLPVRASTPTDNWPRQSDFDEQHWRIEGLTERWATGRETLRLLFRDDPGVIKRRGGRKESHTIYIIPPSVAQRIHAQLSGSDSPFDEWHYRINYLARRWGLGRETVLPRDNGVRLLPKPLSRWLAFEFSAQRAGDVNQARTAFPTPAAFLELPALVVFRTTCFAVFAVAAVELQRHVNFPFEVLRES